MKVRWAAAVLVIALGVAAWLLREPEVVPQPEPAASTAPVQNTEPAVHPESSRGVSPEQAPSPPPQLAARALASAQTTVQTQLTYLTDNQYDLFQQTFAEAMRPQVTREVFDACRVRVTQLPVRPDWEVAEETTNDAGHRVLSVSMFGKSLTPFEETDGRWLAGGLWCVPVGLP